MFSWETPEQHWAFIIPEFHISSQIDDIDKKYYSPVSTVKFHWFTLFQNFQETNADKVF